MKISILDIDRLIAVNKLKEVTSPRLFSNKMMYDPDGILSNDIFGISKSDRRSTFAYIDLKRKFLHPHVYNKVLKGLFRNIVYLIAGQKYYSVNKDGLLVEDPENGWTGIDNLYKNWDSINWNKSSSSNKTSKELLTNLSKDQIFIDKFLVCPPAYRDVTIAGSVDKSDQVDPLNDMYTKLIRAIGLLSEGGLFARTQYSTQYKIQNLLSDIFNYFKDKISHKQGIIRRNLIGKSVDYGVRAVISAPPYNNERFEDNIIDVEHTAVPISMCCSMFYPFIQSWLQNFFTREIINDPNLITYYDKETNTEFTAVLHDPDIQFSEKNIKKMIDDYCLNPDNRFKLIQVDVEVIKQNKPRILKSTMILKGKQIFPNNATKVMSRPMTITDLLYIASVDVCEDKRHVMVSRYPVGTDKGIYFNNIRVQSTVRHIDLIFNGKEYPYYPDIDLKVQPDKVSTQYIDTLVLSNSHCDGMGMR